MPLPHLTNSKAGVNLWDPVHKSIFEVEFVLPGELQADFGADVAILPEHVLTVSGLDALYRAPEVESQKFMGTDRSYIKPVIGETKANIEIEFSLNLRNGTDNFILKLFRAWAALGYDIATGKRVLKKDYVAEFLKIRVANRQGDIYQDIVFKDVMINGALEVAGDLDYTSDEALSLKVKFVSDWWTETIA